ncbi:MAG: hypothetical protein R3C12_11600 [Planctomycetaceae bacterium]|nr:hypothetical protein [Planctomycetaceae bacterium]
MNANTQIQTRVLSLRVPHPGPEPELPIAGELTAWYVTPGDRLKPGSLLYQVSWPGFVIEYRSDVPGIVTRTYAGLRDTLAPEQLVCDIDLTL